VLPPGGGRQSDRVPAEKPVNANRDRPVRAVSALLIGDDDSNTSSIC